MIAREIAMAPVVTVAAPAYLAARGTPRSVAGLDAHDCVGFSPEGAPRPWTFAGGQVHAPRGAFRSHDAGQIRAATLAGLGLAHTPKWLFDDALADGRVIKVLAEFAAIISTAMAAASPSRMRSTSPRTCAVAAFASADAPPRLRPRSHKGCRLG
jgi:DNA-binding transcriptional LysR family regulator